MPSSSLVQQSAQTEAAPPLSRHHSFSQKEGGALWPLTPPPQPTTEMSFSRYFLGFRWFSDCCSSSFTSSSSPLLLFFYFFFVVVFFFFFGVSSLSGWRT